MSRQEYSCIRCGKFIGDEILSGKTGKEPLSHSCDRPYGECGYCGGAMPSCGCNGYGEWPGKLLNTIRIREEARKALAYLEE